jgi:hypothetical protein
MQIAVPDSVTVSMAALMSGIFKRISWVRYVETSTSLGITEDFCGRIRTSSKVRHSANSAIPFLLIPVNIQKREPSGSDFSTPASRSSNF